MSGWPAPTAAGEAWTHLGTQVLSGAVASITFSGVAALEAPRLRLYVYVIKDGSAGAVFVRLNNDSGANYTRQRLSANGGTLVPLRNGGQAELSIIGANTFAANEHGLFRFVIQKPIAGEVARDTVQLAYVTSAGIEVCETSHEWTNTAALVNRVDVISGTANLAVGTRAVLEGAA